MTTQKSIPTKQDIIDTTLSLLSKNGMGKVNIDDIANELKAQPLHVYAYIQQPLDVMRLVVDQVNHDLALAYKAEADVPARDRYFDIFMQRFDLMVPYKGDIKNMLSSLPSHPSLAVKGLPNLDRTINLIINLAGQKSSFPTAIHHKLFLTWVYVSTLRVWINDDSEDMSKTMAHLDQSLSRLDSKLADIPSRLKDIVKRRKAA